MIIKYCKRTRYPNYERTSILGHCDIFGPLFPPFFPPPPKKKTAASCAHDIARDITENAVNSIVIASDDEVSDYSSYEFMVVLGKKVSGKI